uniref:Uncharacterized protein n=1 Tax=Quercus lobata TaxID=97700 RepID=A0A7N2R8B6_QUELO
MKLVGIRKTSFLTNQEQSRSSLKNQTTYGYYTISSCPVTLSPPPLPAKSTTQARSPPLVSNSASKSQSQPLITTRFHPPCESKARTSQPTNTSQLGRFHVDFSTIRCVVIGSPGCVKDEFRGYLLSEAQRLKLKPIEDNKSRIVVATTSPSNTHNLSEVLNDNAVINLIRETNVVPEIRVFKEFLDMLTSNTDRACYGPKSVETAREMLVIETLLIIDDLSGALRLR